MADIIIRNKPARYIASEVCSIVLDWYKAEELKEWHSYNLNRLYISSRDNMEIDIVFNRGWKSTINFNIDIIPDESADGLSDRLIDGVRIGIKDIINNSEEIPFKLSDDEHITMVRINRRVNNKEGSRSDSNYTVEFDTESYDDIIVEDNKLHNNPRIAGKRILVSEIWNKYNLVSSDTNDIIEEFDSLLTKEEVESALQYALDSDEFEDIENNNDEDVNFATMEEIKEVLDFSEELDTFVDNR